MQEHPEALQPFLPEIMAFGEFNHHEILFSILRYSLCMSVCKYQD